MDEWVFVVIAGSLGLLLTLLVNVGLAFYLSFQSTSPEVPANFDQRFLVLETWGCLVPFVWGFSAKWLPVFLGLRALRGRILLLAIALNSGGVLLALAGAILPATVLILTGLVTAITALRLFEPAELHIGCLQRCEIVRTGKMVKRVEKIEEEEGSMSAPITLPHSTT